VNRQSAKTAKQTREPSAELDGLRQVPIGMRYKGQRVGEARGDLLIDGLVIVELKAVDRLGPIHVAQIHSYLKATRLHLGLLTTESVSVLRYGIRRVIRTN
jgi:GxxExxY protein